MRGKTGFFFGTAETTQSLTLPADWSGNGSLRLRTYRSGDWNVVSAEVLKAGALSYSWDMTLQAEDNPNGPFLGFRLSKNQILVRTEGVTQSNFVKTSQGTKTSETVVDVGDDIEIAKVIGNNPPEDIVGGDLSFTYFAFWVE